eukprot:454485-Prorocentrum_minimum.AAC.1
MRAPSGGMPPRLRAHPSYSCRFGTVRGGAATGLATGYIPIDTLRLVRRWGIFLLRRCDWSGGGVYS